MEDQIKKAAQAYADNCLKQSGLQETISELTEITALSYDRLSVRITFRDRSSGKTTDRAFSAGTETAPVLHSILLPFCTEVLNCLVRKSEAQRISELLPKTPALDDAVRQAAIEVVKAEGINAMERLGERLQKESAIVSTGTTALSPQEIEFLAMEVPVINKDELYACSEKHFATFGFTENDRPLIENLLEKGNDVLLTIKEMECLKIYGHENILTFSKEDNEHLYLVIQQLFTLWALSRQTLLSKV